MTKKFLLTNRPLPLSYANGELPPRIHIVPKGELPNRGGTVVQVLDDKALDSILTDLNKRAANEGLYLGEEHFIYNSDLSSQAFAWGKEFEKADDGIWMTKYDVTDVGEQALKNKRFKWTSFVADPEQAGAVQQLGNGRVRILKLDSVGFTNFPNGKALLKPFSNHFADANASAADHNKHNQGHNMNRIALKLGLTAEASEDAILTALTPFLNRADISPADLTTLQNRKTELEQQNRTLLSEQIDADFAMAGIKDEKIVNRHKLLLSDPKHFKNRADRLEFIKDLTKSDDKGGEQQRLLNRGDGKDVTLQAKDATKLAAQAETEIQTYLLTNRCSYEVARNNVRRLKPELFGLK